MGNEIESLFNRISLQSRVYVLTGQEDSLGPVSDSFNRRASSKEPRRGGPGFELPPEGPFRVFPSCDRLLEWWSLDYFRL